MGSLTFIFSGICTHFRFGVVAGVPHRVVLPDASKFMAGLVTVSNDVPDPVTGVVVTPAPPVLYYTTPHFAQLDLEATSPTSEIEYSLAELTIPGLLTNGDFDAGVRIQVINATDTEMIYFGGPPSITDYAHDYNMSSEVVLNGRAPCYVDLYGGTLTMLDPPPSNPGGPKHASIKVNTDGIPKLLISSLLTTPAPSQVAIGEPQNGARSHLLTLAEGGVQDLTMHVNNLEPTPTQGAAYAGGEYDYLLHLLTARGGIPQVLKNTTPGMNEPLVGATGTQIAGALNDLAHVLDPTLNVSEGGNTRSRRRLRPQAETTPSCSCSQYP